MHSYQLLALILIERFGRRSSLLTGIAVMMISLIGLGVCMYFTASTIAGWIGMISMGIYLAGYAISFGPISWLIMAEVSSYLLDTICFSN